MNLSRTLEGMGRLSRTETSLETLAVGLEEVFVSGGRSTIIELLGFPVKAEGYGDQVEEGEGEK